jgi:hypothetical protein
VTSNLCAAILSLPHLAKSGERMGIERIAVGIAEKLAPEFTAEVAGMATRAYPAAARLLESIVPQGLRTAAGALPEIGNVAAADIRRFASGRIGERASYRGLTGESRYRSFRVSNSDVVEGELTGLIGHGRMRDIRAGVRFDIERPVKTEFGNVDLLVMNRPDRHSLHFHVPDSMTVGSALTYDLTAGTATPYAAFLVDDAAGIFAGLFARSGHDKLAQGIGGFSEKIFTSRITALGQAGENKALLAQIASDPARRVPMAGTWMHGRAASVPQARYGLAPLSVPLKTGGLDTCSALCVVDRSRGLQYLAHADATVFPGAIGNSLDRLNMSASESFLLPGVRGMSGTAENVLAALRTIPGAIDRLKVVPWHGGAFPGVVMHQGSLFQPRPY